MPPATGDGKGLALAFWPRKRLSGLGLKAWLSLGSALLRGGNGGLDLATIARQCRAMPQARKKAGSKVSAGAEREQRLAAALRENLRKRKAQQRSRGPAGPEAGSGMPRRSSPTSRESSSSTSRTPTSSGTLWSRGSCRPTTSTNRVLRAVTSRRALLC